LDHDDHTNVDSRDQDNCHSDDVNPDGKEHDIKHNGRNDHKADSNGNIDYPTSEHHNDHEGDIDHDCEDHDGHDEGDCYDHIDEQYGNASVGDENCDSSYDFVINSPLISTNQFCGHDLSPLTSTVQTLTPSSTSITNQIFLHESLDGCHPQTAANIPMLVQTTVAAVSHSPTSSQESQASCGRNIGCSSQDQDNHDGNHHVKDIHGGDIDHKCEDHSNNSQSDCGGDVDRSDMNDHNGDNNQNHQEDNEDSDGHSGEDDREQYNDNNGSDGDHNHNSDKNSDKDEDDNDKNDKNNSKDEDDDNKDTNGQNDDEKDNGNDEKLILPKQLVHTSKSVDFYDLHTNELQSKHYESAVQYFCNLHTILTEQFTRNVITCRVNELKLQICWINGIVNASSTQIFTTSFWFLSRKLLHEVEITDEFVYHGNDELTRHEKKLTIMVAGNVTIQAMPYQNFNGSTKTLECKIVLMSVLVLQHCLNISAGVCHLYHNCMQYPGSIKSNYESCFGLPGGGIDTSIERTFTDRVTIWLAECHLSLQFDCIRELVLSNKPTGNIQCKFNKEMISDLHAIFTDPLQLCSKGSELNHYKEVQMNMQWLTLVSSIWSFGAIDSQQSNMFIRSNIKGTEYVFCKIQNSKIEELNLQDHKFSLGDYFYLISGNVANRNIVSQTSTGDRKRHGFLQEETKATHQCFKQNGSYTCTEMSQHVTTMELNDGSTHYNTSDSLSAKHANITSSTVVGITIEQVTTIERGTTDSIHMIWHLEGSSVVQFYSRQPFLTTVLEALYTAKYCKSGATCEDEILIAEKKLKLDWLRSHKFYATSGMAVRMQCYLRVVLMCLLVKQRNIFLHYCDPLELSPFVQEMYRFANTDVTKLNINRSSNTKLSGCLDLVPQKSISSFRDPVQVYMKVLPVCLDTKCQCWYIVLFLGDNLLQYLMKSMETQLCNNLHLLLNENVILSNLHTSTVYFYNSCNILFSNFNVPSVCTNYIERKRPGSISRTKDDTTFAQRSSVQLICQPTVLSADEENDFTPQKSETKMVIKSNALPDYKQGRNYAHDAVKQQLIRLVVAKVPGRCDTDVRQSGVDSQQCFPHYNDPPYIQAIEEAHLSNLSDDALGALQTDDCRDVGIISTSKKDLQDCTRATSIVVKCEFQKKQGCLHVPVMYYPYHSDHPLLYAMLNVYQSNTNSSLQSHANIEKKLQISEFSMRIDSQDTGVFGGELMISITLTVFQGCRPGCELYNNQMLKLDTKPHYELLQDWGKTERFYILSLPLQCWIRTIFCNEEITEESNNITESVLGHYVPDNDLVYLSSALLNSHPIPSNTDHVNWSTNICYAATQSPSLTFSTDNWLVISHVQVLEKIARRHNTRTKSKAILSIYVILF